MASFSHDSSIGRQRQVLSCAFERAMSPGRSCSSTVFVAERDRALNLIAYPKILHGVERHDAGTGDAPPVWIGHAVRRKLDVFLPIEAIAFVFYVYDNGIIARLEGYICKFIAIFR